ncbi:MAG TPA: hypothetical protein PK869_00055 [Candidatus Hydrogenedentes bacterium]|nr:hypothetical protein [Candidatus Hydrogenedentota bacterium]
MPDDKWHESSTYPFDTYRDPKSSFFIQHQSEVARRRPKPFDPPRTDFTEEEEQIAREEGCYSAAERWEWMQRTENYIATREDISRRGREAFREDMRSIGLTPDALGAMSRAWGLAPVVAGHAGGLRGDPFLKSRGERIHADEASEDGVSERDARFSQNDDPDFEIIERETKLRRIQEDRKASGAAYDAGRKDWRERRKICADGSSCVHELPEWLERWLELSDDREDSGADEDEDGYEVIEESADHWGVSDESNF